jgi:hypothetical protein
LLRAAPNSSLRWKRRDEFGFFVNAYEAHQALAQPRCRHLWTTLALLIAFYRAFPPAGPKSQ